MEITDQTGMYRDLIELTRDVVFASDREGNMTFLNKAGYRMFEAEPADVIGQPWLKWLHPDQREEALRGFREALERGTNILDVEAKYVSKSGKVFEVLVNVSVIRNEAGEIVGTQGFARDITERKRVEQEREQFARYVRLLLESTDEGIYGINLQGECTIINKAGAAMFGYEPEELLGRNIHETVHYSRPDGSPYPVEDCPIIRAFQMGQGIRADNEVFWRKDGTPFPVEYSSHPIVEDGISKGAVVSFFDITERKRAEEALTTSEANYRAIFDTANDAIFIHDLQTGEILDVNRKMSEMYGCTSEEARHLAVKDLSADVPPYTQEDAMRWVRKAAEGEPQLFEWLAKDRTGRLFWVEVNLKRATIGGKDRLLAIVRDITERKRAEQFREEYVSLISHDLRGPLTPILGMAQWLRRVLASKGLAQEAHDAEIIVTNAKRMNSMIQDLVESTHLESGRLQMRKELTDILELISSIASMVTTPEDRARIWIESPQWVPPVTVDRERIERVVMNLLDNAVKYSPSDKPIVVQLGYRDGEAVISVTDQGVGISAQDLPHIFDRYYRVKTGKKTEGLGLGLYIARLIVEAHGGHIWAESELGRGTTFYFTLPAAWRTT